MGEDYSGATPGDARRHCQGQPVAGLGEIYQAGAPAKTALHISQGGPSTQVNDTYLSRGTCSASTRARATIRVGDQRKHMSIWGGEEPRRLVRSQGRVPSGARDDVRGS